MNDPAEAKGMAPPSNLDLPLFVYGALKPGMPAFEQLRPFVDTHYERDRIAGELLVRDGLPLLEVSEGRGPVDGFLLRWKTDKEQEAYHQVCQFEPGKHYEWDKAELVSGTHANVLVIRYPEKGNPIHLPSSEWRLSDDPAFGEGLKAVEEMLDEVERDSGGLQDEDSEKFRCFFRAQMAYMLLWSILERLSALCFGAGENPNKRVGKLHELQGMAEIVASVVDRDDNVFDSRDPKRPIKLDRENAKKCFAYYYQIRSNLSHRGKGVIIEFDKVHHSLRELLEITRRWLGELQKRVEEESGGEQDREAEDCKAALAYSIEEHQHRFAAWAASRAASVKDCRFKVAKGFEILQACGFNEKFTLDKIPESDKIDLVHKQWREAVISAANGEGKTFTHGVAAKLINCYLKARFVCGGQYRSRKVKALHPPIDRLLLDSLAKKNLGGFASDWRKLHDKAWSKFTSAEYEEVINLIRQSIPGRPLWEIEEYWKGHQ